MIDGFIMRDPGSYEDIIDILMDERVISAEEGQAMKSDSSSKNAYARLYSNES